MKKLILTIALVLTMTTTAMAAELLMFSMASCGYCQAFLKEVAPTYAESQFAKLLPLRIISMDRRAAPKWYDKAYNARKIDGIAGTPTFVVFDNGEEKARLIGYQGKQRFYEDIGNFIESNRKYLEMSAGKNPIPFEADTEMDYKQAQVVEEKKVKSEGSHNKNEKKVMPHEGTKLPNGVINSRDIFDHIYKTRTEAEIAAMWLGCRGVHTHNMKDGSIIWMPCEMTPGKHMEK
jgi:thioredoxin-related protein